MLANPASADELAKADPVLDTDGALYRTGATLVVVPNTLAQQWADEIEKNTQGQLVTLLVTTKIQHASISYNSIANADVVIVSSQFLQNPNYFKLGTTSKQPIRPNLFPERDGWVQSMLKVLILFYLFILQLFYRKKKREKHL